MPSFTASGRGCPAVSGARGASTTTRSAAVIGSGVFHAFEPKYARASSLGWKTMLGHMKANEDHQMLVRSLPENTIVAHKTGAVSNARTDAGIIYVPSAKDKKKIQPVAVCVLTNENDDKRWVLDNAAQVTIAEIGKAVYEHYNSKDKN